MTVTVRFAPSPTGWHPYRNARMALTTGCLPARRMASSSLRFDDTDAERSCSEDSKHRGGPALARLDPDLTAGQSQCRDPRPRGPQLRRLLYPCYETSEELSAAAGSSCRVGCRQSAGARR